MSFTLAVCSEMVFLDLAHLDRVRRLDELGFAAELWGWQGRDPDALAATGARFTSMTGYLTGDLITPAGSAELLASAEQSIDFAQRLGARQGLPALNLHGTGLDGDGQAIRPIDVVTGGMWLTARDTLARVAELGQRRGVTFVLENLNTEVDHPGTPFARAADTMALVAAVDSPHLRMNLDLYHAQIGEGNLVELVRRAAPYLGEVQVADVPGRCEPGTGEVRWGFVAQALAEAGHHGVVAMEAFASGPGVQASVDAVESFRAAFTP